VRWSTHFLAGVSSLWLLSAVPGMVGTGSEPNNLGLLAGLAGLGALLPDLDAQDSKIQHLRVGGIPVFVPAARVLGAFGHRGLLHSALGLNLLALLVVLPLALWLGWPAAWALLLGYASHLVLDACTRSGIPLGWPYPRRYHLLPSRLRVTTGSLAEEALLPLVALLALFLLLSTLLAGPGGGA